MIRNWQSTLATLMLADRLHLPQWAARIQISGTPPDRLPEWKSRPFLLVYMHTGGYGILRYWMRSRGIIAGSYGLDQPTVLKLPWGLKILAKAGATHGISGSLNSFTGTRTLREMIKFLVPSRLVTIALDAPSDSSTLYLAGGKYPICVSTGIIRLAALTHAIILPVSVFPRGIGRFDVRFGSPVPDEWIDKRQPQAATQFLLNQLWKNIEEEPSGLGWGSLHSLATHLTIKQHIQYP